MPKHDSADFNSDCTEQNEGNPDRSSHGWIVGFQQTVVIRQSRTLTMMSAIEIYLSLDAQWFNNSSHSLT